MKFLADNCRLESQVIAEKVQSPRESAENICENQREL